ncbi:protein-glutamate O-methyltransferase CheR [Methylobacterium sp. J-059]|uniref:CheR family methyltransferase n=1 Tax=Methylobacterium sp. J-059 TaxID=2836643 RepID=UPI001FBA1B59|nr:protein-glutamate O-methyltransferase CheR [Methylobacterium sp. J-059]MCJ2039698.1 protein-glutamate O-methyltransferase CheR [Methylobacterium sp. J-059]
MRRPPGPSPHDDPGYAVLKARIIARTGHHYYADKDDLLFDRLRRRFKACNVADAAAYDARLNAGAGEWAALEAEITIGETFFFRYAEQFTALRETILPGLIAGRAAERSLRVWSAGCSTGAEPYSVAILLHQLLGPALADWRVAIVGTDISVAALATARAAEYGRWALRTLPVEERLRHFHRIPASPGAAREGGYALRPEFRRMVRFERQNLMSLVDGTAAEGFDGFDLILCRNVLIYFSAETVAAIVRALGRRLRPGGWLLIGHAEPHPAFACWLDAVNLPGTVAYRRPLESASLPAPPDPAEPAGLERPPAATPIEPGPALEALLAVPAGDAVAEAIRPVPAASAPTVVDETAEDVARTIRMLADSGDTGAAWRLLRNALAARPTDASLRLYEGLLALGFGREAEAERAFRGALYLDRGYVMAHYHLGLLLGALGRTADARRALDNAVALSQALPPDAALPEGDGARAGEIALSAAAIRDGIGTGAA